MLELQSQFWIKTHGNASIIHQAKPEQTEMPISVCLMEEKLPKLSDLSFCISHISVLWLCSTCHKVLWPSSLFRSWMALRHQLVAWHLIPGLVLPLVMDMSLERKSMGRAQQNPSAGLLSSKRCPTRSPWTSCHSLLLAPFLWTLQPLWTTLSSLLVSTSFWNLLYF